MKNLKHLLLLAACISITACANRATATLIQAKISSAQNVFYAERFEPDKTQSQRTYEGQHLSRGYQATAGEQGEAPDDATIIVTYIDKVAVDITNHMIELTITFRDAETGAAIATGNSYHTSLTRKSPPEMVDEVLTNMFAADHGEVTEESK